MKRFIAILLAFALVLGLCACGSSAKDDASPMKQEPASEPTPEPTPESTPVPAKDLLLGEEASNGGKYSFVVSGASFGDRLVEKSGSRTSSFASNGSYLFYLKLRYTNKTSATFAQTETDRITDIRLVSGSGTEYAGKVRVISGEIVSLSTAYVYLYFEIPKDLENDPKDLVVFFTADGDPYRVVVFDSEGNNMLLPSSNTSAVKIAKGEKVEGNDRSSFTIEKIFYADKISEKHGNVTRTFGGSNNKYYLVLMLDFTNLHKEALDESNTSRVENITLTYRDTYIYDGDCRTLSGDIAPLDHAKLYIYYEVPTLMESDLDPLIASFTIDGTTYLVDCRE